MLVFTSTPTLRPTYLIAGALVFYSGEGGVVVIEFDGIPFYVKDRQTAFQVSDRKTAFEVPSGDY